MDRDNCMKWFDEPTRNPITKRKITINKGVYKKLEKDCSKYKTSKKRTSPKRMSPKRMSPKRMSPKRMSPNKIISSRKVDIEKLTKGINTLFNTLVVPEYDPVVNWKIISRKEREIIRECAKRIPIIKLSIKKVYKECGLDPNPSRTEFIKTVIIDILNQ